MNQLERWVVLVNGLLAASAATANAYAGVRSPEPWRSVRMPIAALASIYSLAYLWLFITQDIGPWSSVMRGFSLLAWPIVWVRPAIVNLRIVDAMRKAVKTASAVADRTIGDQK